MTGVFFLPLSVSLVVVILDFLRVRPVLSTSCRHTLAKAAILAVNGRSG
jgi:hypothetical protein